MLLLLPVVLGYSAVLLLDPGGASLLNGKATYTHKKEPHFKMQIMYNGLFIDGWCKGVIEREREDVEYLHALYCFAKCMALEIDADRVVLKSILIKPRFVLVSSASYTLSMLFVVCAGWTSVRMETPERYCCWRRCCVECKQVKLAT